LPPDWFVTTSLLDAYRDAGVDLETGAANSLWPEDKRFAVVLTHDVETAAGVAMIDEVSSIEESLGFRSSWNFVPQAYRVETPMLADLRRRGFEVGVHGLNHDGCLYSSRHEFARRAGEINTWLKEWGALGFRSPQVHRNLGWLQDLEIEYDSSCFDVDPLQPMPGGCGSPWPFEVGRFVEIPYTLPQDHVLYIVLKEKTNDIWKRKTEWLVKHSGMVCLITHPDYLADPSVLDLYRDFLEYLATLRGGWNILPQELARYWRQRSVPGGSS
jgi:peptidoglycan/xylan/chitin deacetylase (PgdA/CDA1 family)